MLHDRDKTNKLLDAADRKSEGKKAGRLSEIRAEIKAMLRLVRSYANGDYRAVSWESLVLIAGGLIYLANPLDAIPDVLQPAGYLDDAAVLMFVIGMVADELHDFMEWEKKQGKSK